MTIDYGCNENTPPSGNSNDESKKGGIRHLVKSL